MYDCIKEKSTEAAAEAVRRVTVQIWTDRELAAQAAAERAAHDEGADETECIRAGWGGRTRALDTRGPVIWTVYETPDRKRRWLLAPPTLEMQTDDPYEVEQARARGDVVVGPDDQIQDVIDTMEAAQSIRAASPVRQ
jgi:hypothetical protein